MEQPCCAALPTSRTRRSRIAHPYRGLAEGAKKRQEEVILSAAAAQKAVDFIANSKGRLPRPKSMTRGGMLQDG
jgi:hypothetical protein